MNETLHTTALFDERQADAGGMESLSDLESAGLRRLSQPVAKHIDPLVLYAGNTHTHPDTRAAQIAAGIEEDS
jgi:hypothetical protein